MNLPNQGLSALIAALVTILIPLFIFWLLTRAEKKHQSQNKSDH